MQSMYVSQVSCQNSFKSNLLINLYFIFVSFIFYSFCTIFGLRLFFGLFCFELQQSP